MPREPLEPPPDELSQETRETLHALLSGETPVANLLQDPGERPDEDGENSEESQ